MANVITTPYMFLSLPIVGTEVGPAWANEVNAAFTTVDAHTHITGQGQPIPTAGLNINADLSFNTAYNLIAIRSIRPVNQVTALSLASDINCIYVTGGNLYFNDVSGNQIQLTLAGNVNTSSSGNITGMGATTASVAYSSATKTFTFLSNTAVPALMAIGPTAITSTTDAVDLSITGYATQTNNLFLVQDSSLNLLLAVSATAGTQIRGTTTTSVAASGFVGEVLTSGQIGSGINVGSITALGSLALTAGNWFVMAFCSYNGAGGIPYYSAYLSTTTASTLGTVQGVTAANATITTASGVGNSIGPLMTTSNSSGAVTYYLNCQNQGNQASGQGGIFGNIIAIRIS